MSGDDRKRYEKLVASAREGLNWSVQFINFEANFCIVGADPVCTDPTRNYGYLTGEPCALIHVTKVCCVFHMQHHTNRICVCI